LETACPHAVESTNEIKNGLRAGRLQNSSTINLSPITDHSGATATETELRNYARDHLAHFKCPQKIHFVPKLPKTATGKVQKYVLRGKPAISKQ
jgi:acyl-coenzyme A synthetase/AMP-(fatty) acid ligase